MFDKFILNFLRRGEGERRGWNGTWDLKMAEEFEVRGNGAFDADTIYDLLKGWSFFFFILLFFPSFILPPPPPFVEESKLLRVYANVDMMCDDL